MLVCFSRLSSLVFFPIICLLGCGLMGCTGGSPQSTVPPEVTASQSSHGHDHDHDHPSEGPHQGDLVELGNGKYHVEIVHQADQPVTVYILDDKAAGAVPIAATEVKLNTVQSGKATQHVLPALPQAEDPEGTSSRFVTEAPEVAVALSAEGTTVRLSITIDGTAYSGKLEHHDHAGHKH